MKTAAACTWLLATLALMGCGSDGGEGDGAEPLEPGREVAGCFDCAAEEYCILVDVETDEFFCAPNGCGEDCGCLMDDAAKRHDECSSSCQEGSGMVYCKP